MKVKFTNKIALFAATLMTTFSGMAQNNNENKGEIHGNFESINQYYLEDTIIGAKPVDEQALMNSFANLIFTKGDFKAGVRYESYLNALNGFDKGYQGSGFAYRYATYSKDELDVTVGNFYEQFGTGTLFRAYEARQLGIDNAMDGIRLKYKAADGVYLKGIYGKQRLFFDVGPGIVRGFDAEVNVNEMSERLDSIKTYITIGGNFVSKFQEDKSSKYNLPENVAAFSGRANINRGKFNFFGEYAYKMNDPSADNQFIYKPGRSIYGELSYSQKGLGINLGGKMIDNMSFRSDREQGLLNLNMNYLPALTKQHTYNLAATLYPYSTQPQGEASAQLDVIFKLPKKTKIGGKYGSTITLNTSMVNSLDTTRYYDYVANRYEVNDSDPGRLGYKTNFFGIGDRRYFRDINVEVLRKINKKLKVKATYFYMEYDMEIAQGLGGKPYIYSDIIVADILYKFNSKNALRTEVQYLFTEQHYGDWATVLFEYTRSPHWFAAIMDQWNLGNKDPDHRVHYFYGTVGYIKNATRFTIAYGRQREGIFCVGGVCRNVPAMNGVTLSVTSSF